MNKLILFLLVFLSIPFAQAKDRGEVNWWTELDLGDNEPPKPRANLRDLSADPNLVYVELFATFAVTQEGCRQNGRVRPDPKSWFPYVCVGGSYDGYPVSAIRRSARR